MSARRKPHIPMKVGREDVIAARHAKVRGVDTWWSHRDNAWTKEEAEPCGVAGGLSFYYATCTVHGRRPPDISDVLAIRRKPWLLTVWEPLQTKAPRPPKAQPYCCYSNTIIFYHSPYIVWPFPKLWRDGRGILRPNSGNTFLEWDSIETRFNSHHDIVRFEGERFAFTGATVLWKKRRWWMRYGARIVKDER